jgi:hypothetical protein
MVPSIIFAGRPACQRNVLKGWYLFPFDGHFGQLGNVGAPAQVLNAVPETFFSVLRNSQRLGHGIVSPFVSPARKLTPTPPSLFSPLGRETLPAQSSTDFLIHARRLGQQNGSGCPQKTSREG